MLLYTNVSNFSMDVIELISLNRILFINCMRIYRVSGISRTNVHEMIEQTKLSRKVFFHFAIFAILNKLLIAKYRRNRLAYR